MNNDRIKTILEAFDEKFLRPDRHWKLSANGNFDYTPEELKSFLEASLTAVAEEAKQSIREKVENEWIVDCDHGKEENSKCSCQYKNEVISSLLESIK